ncbi:four-carbon acid sugar kinase family protein [Ruania zhangjianzhongii]|uniref:four-carbon acid sugar kinase family protein n=1 Tax=Ruania zhangjianzhongii TaxID=2603206 RepID=UPI0011CBA02A|nr:four-carbon acid sugar kinase family protein [Ruania zhangjianzhongii]
MKVGFYGDDFTGSIDALLQLRRAGLTGVLATSVAHAESLRSDSEAVGIAGVARSLRTADLPAEVLPALRWFAGRGAPIVQYKACSTADSSPEVGSLGKVIELGREVFGAAAVPAVFAQPDFGRYTFFGHHFARDDDRVFRLDRQPTMRDHPSTPSTESDLARHLGAQTELPIGALAWPQYETGPDPARHVAQTLAESGAAAVVCDGFTDAHLDLLGRAISHRSGQLGSTASSDGAGTDQLGTRFVLGAGGLSLGLGRAIGGTAAPLPERASAADGPCLALSGSRSARTWAQIEAATHAGWTCIDLRGPGAAARAIAAHAAGADTVFHSSTPGGGQLQAAEVTEALLEVALPRLQAAPRTRLLLCGGDTSGTVLRRLGVAALTIESCPWGNVALCAAQAPGRGYDSVEVVLKGGQMGHVDLLEDVRRGHTTEPATSSSRPPEPMDPPEKETSRC